MGYNSLITRLASLIRKPYIGPTRVQFSKEKKDFLDITYCFIEKDRCCECFISLDKNYKGCGRCDKCKVAIEHEKEKIEK